MATNLFNAKVKTFGPRLMKDVGATDYQAAGAFGNFGVETAGFTKMQEMKPTVKGSRGGWGWPQWTGPRRRAFEAWVTPAGFNIGEDEGMYQFLLVELRGPEKAACQAWLATKTLDEATTVFMKRFERPGVQHLDKRKDWAKKALAVLRPAKPGRAASPARITPVKPFIQTPEYLKEQSSIGLDKRIIEPLQAHLKKLGYYKYDVEGDWGERTRNAVIAWCADHDVDTGKPWLTQPIYDGIMGDTQPQGVSVERAQANVQDIKKANPDVVGPVLKQKSGAAIGTLTAGGGFLASVLPDDWDPLSVLTTMQGFLQGVPYQLWLAIGACTYGLWWWSNSKTMEGLRQAWRSRNLVG